jgi:hypothetical protein
MLRISLRAEYGGARNIAPVTTPGTTNLASNIDQKGAGSVAGAPQHFTITLSITAPVTGRAFAAPPCVPIGRKKNVDARDEHGKPPQRAVQSYRKLL